MTTTRQWVGDGKDRALAEAGGSPPAQSIGGPNSSGVPTLQLDLPLRRRRAVHPKRHDCAQLLGMQRALRKASAEALREGIQVQIERVEQAMEKMSVRPGRKVCEAMRGLVEEAQHEIEEHGEKGPILDLVIVAGMQRIEHYEIAAYGTNVALAKAIGEKEVAD
jgi:Domain of unknown function (DUF892)